jgi:hypothetical protein
MESDNNRFRDAILDSVPAQIAVLGLPFTHNYFHPELAEASANPAHIICKQA